MYAYTGNKDQVVEFESSRRQARATGRVPASAVVGFTLGPRAVEWAAWVRESGGRDSNRMDRHNNVIGAGIGASARSFSEIEPAVHARVLRGAVNAPDPGQVTWLPPERWGASRLR